MYVAGTDDAHQHDMTSNFIISGERDIPQARQGHGVGQLGGDLPLRAIPADDHIPRADGPVLQKR